MKQNPPKKTNTRKAKKKASLISIDLDLKAVFFFLVLVILTAIVVFYLGVLFGKASRKPADILPFSTVPTVEDQTDRVTPNDLKIYDLKTEPEANLENDQALSELKEDSQRVMDEADELLSQKVVTREKAEPARVEEPEESDEDFVPSWPESQSTSSSEKLYTIQVIATGDQTKAKDLVKQLRIKSFDAYMEEFKIEGRTIYRVRVGKANQTDLNSVLVDLNKAIGGMGQSPRIVVAN